MIGGPNEITGKKQQEKQSADIAVFFIRLFEKTRQLEPLNAKRLMAVEMLENSKLFSVRELYDG